MQHYGAPTRLLDWTYSFFVALYFAMESADERECAVWALNTDWMVEPFESVLHRHPDALQCWTSDCRITRRSTFKQLFMRASPLTLVGAVTPYRLNERLVKQQGVFLCPGDVSKTLEENLVALLSEPKIDSRANFMKLTIDGSLAMRRDILLNLHRMNMHRATLFPGLEGFAQSLRTLLVSPEVLAHEGAEP